MTREAFLDWAERQDARYEFDGTAPVGMVGSTLAHSRIAQNLWRAIDRQLSGTRCEAFLQDVGIATKGEAVRFPDVTISCMPAAGHLRIVPNPVAVFEVLSPSSGRTDRILKLEEYRAVRSIAFYGVLEQDSAAMTVFRRQPSDHWHASALAEGDVLTYDDPALSIPLSEIYARVAFGPDLS